MSKASSFEDCVKLAREDVAGMDATDGWKNRNLDVICMALITGLQMPETNSQYDALVMLEDLTGMDSLKYKQKKAE